MNRPRQITCLVNGEQRTFHVEADEKLLDVLRRAGYVGVKQGCREGVCGACTVILDGRAVYSCLLYAWQAHGRSVWTIEGAGTFEQPHPFQQALVEEGAVQCGFCIPGIVMSAKALLDANPRPDEAEIRQKLDGNLCRCTGYEKILAALRRVIAKSKA